MRDGKLDKGWSGSSHACESAASRAMGPNGARREGLVRHRAQADRHYAFSCVTTVHRALPQDGLVPLLFG
ncbi:hypothetical protein GCM10009554_37650 [Kribbella koreensis]|uniref:Uncharacterized protein n=2 Tax=Kribbella TaxID=182639 RepID=A0ABP6X4X5_9ACTN